MSCRACHAAIVDNFLLTPHYRSTTDDVGKYILGDFDNLNRFTFPGGAIVEMTREDGVFYQTAFEGNKQAIKQSMDVVVGSGKKGQSFLHWTERGLVQMPMTWFTPLNQWTVSPGYPNKAVFNRPVTLRCMECHATHAEATVFNGNEFVQPNGLVPGVRCSSCHGDGQAHIEFHTADKQALVPRFITSPGKMTRGQSLDACGLCHAGGLAKTSPSFSFQPGDSLLKFFAKLPPAPFTNELDVHGNQMGLLEMSACFKQSQLTCTTCHVTHQPERRDLALFSQTCMQCHADNSPQFCTNTAVAKSNLIKNCIDCHMPYQPSMAIAVYAEGNDNPVRAQLRTHFIKVYDQN